MGHLISGILNGTYTQWVLPFLFVLTVIVLFHELGHYLVARLCGVRVIAFSLGFGRELLGFTDRNGTRWKISAIPLGGYVKFFGDDNAASVPDPARLAEMNPEERRLSFPGQPVGNRAAVAVAGPLVNFILAIVIFAGVALVWGNETGRVIPRIGGIEAGSAAAAAGISPGDLIVNIDGQTVETFDDVARIISGNPGRPLSITVDRNGVLTTIAATPADVDHRGRLGISSSKDGIEMKAVTPVEALQIGTRKTWEIIAGTMGALRDLVVGRGSADGLGGPIMIAQLSGKVAQLGFDKLLAFTAMLSASVGLFNLFPIPILDGGHLVFCLIEGVLGRPLSVKAQELSLQIGFVAIMMLLAYVVTHDVWRILS